MQRNLQIQVENKCSIPEQWQIKGCGRPFRCITFSLISHGCQKFKKNRQIGSYSVRNPKFSNSKV